MKSCFLLPIAAAQFIAWFIIALILVRYLDAPLFLWLILVGFIFYLALWITNHIATK